MKSKNKTKTSFSETILLIAGIIVMYAGFTVLGVLFIFGIMVVISAFMADASISERVISIVIGLILMVPGILYVKHPTASRRKTSKKAASRKNTWLATYGFLVLFILAFVACLPNAIYWTGNSIEAMRIKNQGVETTAQVTVDDQWSYPLVLVSNMRHAFIGVPKDTDSASVDFTVDGKKYTAHTMVEHKSKANLAEVSVWYSPENPERVATSSLVWESTLQAILFSALTLIFGLASVLYIRTLFKDKSAADTAK